MVEIEQDPYAVLGVTRSATDEDVEEAFQRFARRRALPDDDVVEAYKVLSHPRRRLRYDCFGVRTRLRRRGTEASGISPIMISLKWHEAERGVLRFAEFAESVLCAACRGRGYEHGATPDACPRCGGTGRLSLPEGDPEEIHVLDVSACLACEGRGHGPAPRCATCSGTGATVAERGVTVRVPRGLHDGDQLMVYGVARPFQLSIGVRLSDSKVVRALFGVALVCATCFLTYLLLHH